MNKNNPTPERSGLLFPHSIMGRLLLASLVLLPLFCGLLGFSLDRAFTSSLRSGEQAQLTLQAYALIAAAEFEENSLWLPEQLTEDRLNQPSSDLFAAVFSGNNKQPLWQSPSSVSGAIPDHWQAHSLTTGQSYFGEITNQQEALYYLQYSVFWEDESGTEHPFQFVIFENQRNICDQLTTYRQNLWGWLSAIALSIATIQVVVLKWGLKPIREVSNDLKQIQQGQFTQLKGRYPSELREMTNSINTLLNNEAQQRERYQNTLSDLAHSLKTPLAIMQGSLHSPTNSRAEELEEQINRIDQIISYQLKRSVSAPMNPFTHTTPIKENCLKVVSALKKVYWDKPTRVTIDIPDTLLFRGDKGDLLELLGNLLDNAFKYGGGEISVSGEQLEENRVSINIHDNGPGIPKARSKQLLQRGERADTTLPGQGIGLSVVADIVSSYRGSVEFKSPPEGGLVVTMQL